ncbi:hypothetical protein LXT21_19470 [Myxococcus sp. K38C18041901]|uniref:hypothetical protein n=1 Tax=Myxococcus guangdongensis TaxID=2906760 RepID=UPI0020A8355C|nr:hypothetical protein [Myxococcus guangdongensis]MCP3060969.1 hypothetical protein [Myxococcus guangdongensis]
MHASTQDFQVFYKAVGVAGGALTAGGAGDAVEVTGGAVDRNGFDFAQLLFTGTTNCAAGQTLKATVKVAESEDGVTFGPDETLANAVTVVAGATAPQSFCLRVDLRVANRKRFVRLKVTPDLSAAGTDTAQWGAALVLGGADEFPVR